MNDSWRQVVGFAVAGTAGFAVDLFILSLLAGHGADPFAARAGSIAFAVATTYLINRTVTFRSTARGRRMALEASRYLAASAFGLLINATLYVVALVVFGAAPLIAAAAATFATMFVNFVSYSRVTFVTE